NLITHFEGITGNGTGGYNLASDLVNVSSGVIIQAALVKVPRLPMGQFGTAKFTDFGFPGASLTSANTVIDTDILGIYQQGTDVSNGYVAFINSQKVAVPAEQARNSAN